jgi:hypothetical protein
MHRATDDLIASGQAERAVKVGDTAPSFSLPDQDGKTITLAELLTNGPVVLTFYRGAWCSYCKMDLGALEAEAGSLRQTLRGHYGWPDGSLHHERGHDPARASRSESTPMTRRRKAMVCASV